MARAPPRDSEADQGHRRVPAAMAQPSLARAGHQDREGDNVPAPVFSADQARRVATRVIQSSTTSGRDSSSDLTPRDAAPVTLSDNTSGRVSNTDLAPRVAASVIQTATMASNKPTQGKIDLKQHRRDTRTGPADDLNDAEVVVSTKAQAKYRGSGVHHDEQPNFSDKTARNLLEDDLDDFAFVISANNKDKFRDRRLRPDAKKHLPTDKSTMDLRSVSLVDSNSQRRRHGFKEPPALPGLSTQTQPHGTNRGIDWRAAPVVFSTAKKTITSGLQMLSTKAPSLIPEKSVLAFDDSDTDDAPVVISKPSGIAKPKPSISKSKAPTMSTSSTLALDLALAQEDRDDRAATVPVSESTGKKEASRPRFLCNTKPVLSDFSAKELALARKDRAPVNFTLVDMPTGAFLHHYNSPPLDYDRPFDDDFVYHKSCMPMAPNNHPAFATDELQQTWLRARRDEIVDFRYKELSERKGLEATRRALAKQCTKIWKAKLRARCSEKKFAYEDREDDVFWDFLNPNNAETTVTKLQKELRATIDRRTKTAQGAIVGGNQKASQSDCSSKTKEAKSSGPSGTRRSRGESWMHYRSSWVSDVSADESSEDDCEDFMGSSKDVRQAAWAAKTKWADKLIESVDQAIKPNDMGAEPSEIEKYQFRMPKDKAVGGEKQECMEDWELEAGLEDWKTTMSRRQRQRMRGGKTGRKGL